MYSIFLNYSSIIDDPAIFTKVSQVCIKQLCSSNISYDSKNIDYLLPFEIKTKFQYLISENSFYNQLIYLGISLCNLYCFCVDEENLLTSFLKEVYDNNLNILAPKTNANKYAKTQKSEGYRYVDCEDYEAIKKGISTGQTVLIQDPS